MTLRPDHCENCRSWQIAIEKDKTIGHCQLYPPKVVPKNCGVETVFPLTLRNDWCGQWQPKEDVIDKLIACMEKDKET